MTEQKFVNNTNIILLFASVHGHNNYFCTKQGHEAERRDFEGGKT